MAKRKGRGFNILRVNVAKKATEKATEEKKIYELSDEDLKEHKLIGKADGEDLIHCVYLAMRYAKDFFERVCGYQIRRPKDKRYKVQVAFYEKKKKK